jgi:hypothetical protein
MGGYQKRYLKSGYKKRILVEIPYKILSFIDVFLK